MWLTEIRVWIQVSSYDLVQESYPSFVKGISNFLVGCQVKNSELGATNPGMPSKQWGKESTYNVLCKEHCQSPWRHPITQE